MEHVRGIRQKSKDWNYATMTAALATSLATAPAIVRPVGLRRGSSFYPELESLRGVAILLVVLFHTYSAFFGALDVPVSPRVSLALVQGGHTGVTLFFVLSAFLLGMPFIRAPLQGARRPSIGSFFIRRFLRIAPLYIVAVVVATIALKDVQTGARALLFSAEGMEMYPYSAVWWSLRVEVQFYLLLPLIGISFWHRRGRWVMGALVVVYLVSYFSVYLLLDPEARVDGHSLFGRGVIFLIGLSAAYVYLRYGEVVKARTRSSQLWTKGGSDVLLLVIMASLAVLLNKISEIGYFKTEIHFQYLHIVESILWASVLLVLLIFPLHLKLVLHNAFLSLLGVWSYSLYLNHYPIVLIGIASAPSLILSADKVDSPARIAYVVALVAAAMLLAGITYSTIEKPFLRKKARLT